MRGSADVMCCASFRFNSAILRYSLIKLFAADRLRCVRDSRLLLDLLRPKLKSGLDLILAIFSSKRMFWRSISKFLSTKISLFHTVCLKLESFSFVVVVLPHLVLRFVALLDHVIDTALLKRLNSGQVTLICSKDRNCTYCLRYLMSRMESTWWQSGCIYLI